MNNSIHSQMIRILLYGIVLVFFVQCTRTKTDDSQEISSDNSTKLVLQQKEWESLRAASEYKVLREGVEEHLTSLHKSGKPVPLYVYYYMAQSYQFGPFNIGLAYCDSALSAETKSTYLYQKCEALKGALLRKDGQYQKSIEFMRPLLASVINDSIQSEINWQLSISYRKLDLYDSALYHSQSAERVANKIKNQKYQYYAIQSMANIYSSLGEFDRALQTEKKLMSIARQMGKKNLIISNTTNLAVSYFDLDQKDSALYYYAKAQALATEVNDLENQSLLFTIYANYLIEKGSFSEAERLMLKALTLSQQSGRKDIVVRSYFYLCKANLGNEDYEQAIEYAKAGISLAKEIGASSELGPFYELLSNVFEKRGDYKNAFAYSEEYREVMDSVLNVSKIKTIKDLEIRYETEKKQKEIESLVQKAAIQELKLQQRNLMIGFAVILVLVLILINRQRVVNEKRKTVEMKQQLLRSQLNPHFIFNALGAIQHFIYQNHNPVETGDYLGKFSQLTRLILNHTQKSLITLEEEIQFLDSYLVLQKLRFDEPFEYQISTDNDLEIEDVLVPPMFIQPFIENSIEHGILYKQEKGVIEISFLKRAGLLEIVLKDNGIGRERASFMQRNQKHRSLATQITLDRIKILQKGFRKRANLQIEDIVDRQEKVIGTQVTVSLPLIYQN